MDDLVEADNLLRKRDELIDFLGEGGMPGLLDLESPVQHAGSLRHEEEREHIHQEGVGAGTSLGKRRSGDAFQVGEEV